MGTRGPVPKRSTERRRRNKDSKPDIVVIEATAPAAAVVVVPKPNRLWHPIARDWFKSLSESGQAQYFEPSDWQAARYVAEVMSKNLKQPKFSSMLFQSIWTAMQDLLTTEAARRRVRMEIERKPAGDEPAPGVIAIADYRKRLAAK